MASIAPIISPLSGHRYFFYFMSLPPEIRFIIWRFSLLPRIVEIITSENCTTGFFSQAALPAVLHTCRESRQAVEMLYPYCFGSFLQPERVRFNFDLDILYLDISQEEEGLFRLFGILKETELTRLKYVAIEDTYLHDVMNNHHLTIEGLKRALIAMTDLKELTIVRDITVRGWESHSLPAVQIKFYTEGESEEGWPADVEELPHVEEGLAGWRLPKAVKITAVNGWRERNI